VDLGAGDEQPHLEFADRAATGLNALLVVQARKKRACRASKSCELPWLPRSTGCNEQWPEAPMNESDLGRNELPGHDVRMIGKRA
jgi:hypothetical protein